MKDLYKKLELYRESDFYPFHMPGHKRNKEAVTGVLAGAYGIDISEIDGFDNLHQSQGILDRQQQKAAELYNSEMTCFMVNGSTGGVLSAIAACTGKGDRLLMARNCHKSVYHAVYLQELTISFLYSHIIMPYGIAGAICPRAVEAALQKEAGIAAVIVTSPTYEGVVSDISQIADIAHKYGKPLIVDEAHGAHFGFHEDYPESSVRLGADIVIHSVHKTLPAMTQTALIHVNGSMVNRTRLARYLRIFQSSSPSYVLLASIDSCMDFMAREGRKRLDVLLQRRRRLLQRLEQCIHIKAMDADVLKIEIDPCKLVIYAADGFITGQELYDILRDKYHLQLEMAAGSYVVAIITLMDTEDGFERLIDALYAIDSGLNQRIAVEYTGEYTGEYDNASGELMTISQAYNEESEDIFLEEAAGRIAAEFVSIYPPGIPVIVPGERLDKHIISQIIHYEKMHLNVQGIIDKQIKVIKQYPKN